MALDQIERMFLIFLFMKIDLHFCYEIALQTWASLSLEKSLDNKQNWQIGKKIYVQKYKYSNNTNLRIWTKKSKIGNTPPLRH